MSAPKTTVHEIENTRNATVPMNSYEWVETLRTINCMEVDDFRQCFGNQGDYLWGKFVGEKNADIFAFLCYLDLINAEKLFQYTLKKVRERPQPNWETIRALEALSEKISSEEI